MLGSYGEDADFFTMKGEIEAIFKGLRTKKASYAAVKDNPSYHPGRCASITMDGKDIGIFGQVHPLVAKNFGIDAPVYAAELNFTVLSELLEPEATYKPLPKYPAVTRDIAVVADEAVTVAQLENAIIAGGGKLLRDVKLFDIYRGKGVEDGKKSVAFNLVLRADDRTLTDVDSEGVFRSILEKLASDCNAKLR
jgi:phenylalanyl-tRNA synthetase beta chain